MCFDAPVLGSAAIPLNGFLVVLRYVLAIAVGRSNAILCSNIAPFGSEALQFGRILLALLPSVFIAICRF